MKRFVFVAGVTLIAASSLSFAAAPVLHASKSVTINAPAAKVWEAAKNFDGLNTWHPAVATDQILEGSSNQVGAVRLLTLKDGGTIKEKLLGFDAANQSFKYSILEGVLPVTSYTSTFVVKDAGGGKSEVTWSGEFKRKNVADNPQPNEDDKTAVTTMGSVYQGGLDNLKKIVETK